MEKKYKVIACHPYTGGCDRSCSFCYKKKEVTKDTKPLDFWYELIPYMAQLTDQLACGSNGEPFMDSAFVSKFAKTCKDNNLICNVTTNGKKLMEMKDNELQSVLSDITMVSISFDSEKIRNAQDTENYKKLVQRIKKLTTCQIGCNLLVEEYLYQNKGNMQGLKLAVLVSWLFKIVKIDRVFALYPKNIKGPDIKNNRLAYEYLTSIYENFYTDDLSKMILEQGYTDWSKPCHYGQDIISIDESGYICGCSFDNPDKAILKLEKPEDLLQIKEIKIEERFKCPYLNV
jgi:organic radical activating enzyme